MAKKSGKKRTKSRGARPIFETLRKPVAPPGHPINQSKPEERVHPAERKVKHKQPVETEE